MNITTLSPVIITGMHRSGTSLTASLLQSAGINIGQKLIGPGNGNLLGHFEDIDFCQLHCTFLVSQGIHKDGWTTQPQVDVPILLQQTAKTLYQQKSQYSQKCSRIWGWKDPRTTLFLNLWKAVIPEAKFIFVYRQPHQVIASLLQRGDRTFIQHPQLAAKSWLVYNQAILQFYQQNMANCFLFSVDNFHSHKKRSHEEAILQQIYQKLDLPLTLSCSKVYKPNELHNPTKPPFYQHTTHTHIVQIEQLYQKLEAVADMPTRANG